ncbi:MAG: primosomal protein N' [Legionellales bacterium]|nr:primosomal protein N' [Legionellales bacterium]
MLKPTIVHIAMATPLRNCFDYRLDDTQRIPAIGARVLVPFGARQMVGIVIAVDTHTELALKQLKPIIRILDETPLIDETLLKLCHWASDYYHHPLGDVLSSALPKLLREGREANLSSTNKITSKKKMNDDDKPSIILNSEQIAAVEKITAQLDHFATFLLDGVTGSGKTEIYLQIIEKVLQHHKQILVLVPEIALTPQTMIRFTHRFGDQVTVLHSGLTDKTRMQIWLKIRDATIPIVIGTRSAIFTPCRQLGLIILDEEHDLSFKQQEGFRYSARDLAIVRAKQCAIPIILGSATPSLESYLNAKQRRYHYLQLTERAGNAMLPKINIIDLRSQELKANLTPTVIEGIHQTLEKKQQVLLFLNRRGYAPLVMCHQCGWMADCKNCDAHLTWHAAEKKLFCHHCGANQNLFKHCPQCQAQTLFTVGIGTEKLVEQLTQLFPDKTIVRIDRDTTRKKGELEKLLTQIQNNQAEIIVGTQMIAKGHHFPKVTMVVIVDADSGLLSADFRASERMGQLLMQVSGRAGREDQFGQVYIQTHQPQHQLLQCLIKHDYHQFLTVLTQERRIAQLPPFSYLALVRSDAKQRQDAIEFLESFKKYLINENITVLGPIPALLEKRAGKYRALLLLNAKQRAPLHAAIKKCLKKIEHTSQPRVRWSVEIDPQDVLS